DDLTYTACGDTTFSFDVSGYDVDDNLVGCSMISGPGTLENGVWTFTTSGPGTYTAFFECIDECGLTCSGEVTITIESDNPPAIVCPPSDVLQLCGPETILIPLTVSPADAQLTITPAVEYSDGIMSFQADTAGQYCFTINASTDCGTDQCQFCVNVIFNSAPVVTMNDTTLFQCDTEEICLPVFISDDDSVLTVTVYPEAYSIDNGSICFTPDGPGLFEFIVTVTDECNFTTVDTARVEVFRNQPPEVTVGDTSLFVCEPAEICLPVNYSDADNNIDSITVSAPAVYDEQNETVCLTVSESGDYEVIVAVYDECNVIAADTGLISVTVNSDPTVMAPADTEIFYCQPGEICLDGFDIFDADDNITNIEFIPALGSYSNGSYCFTPDTAGVYCMTVRVTDECGSVAEDTVCVTYGLGENVTIDCPEGVQLVTLCQPDSVCLDIPIAPLDAIVTVTGGDAVYADGRLCFYAESSGTYAFTLVADNDCGTDTCQVEFEVTLGQAPQLSCPPSEQIHLCSPDSISVPLGVIPAEAALTITPEAVYANGQLTFMADTAGQYCFNIETETECGVDQCQFCITVTIDSPPEITVPDSLVALCELSEICLPIAFGDPNDNIASIAVESQRFEYANGQVCFIPDGPGTYGIIITVTDSCGLSAVDTGTVVVTIGESPQITCPPSESIHLCGPDNISIPLGILPATADLTFTPDDVVYENGMLTFMADTAGVYCFNIKAATECGTDACDFCITVTLDAPPQVSIPDTLIALCASEEVCVPVSYFDPNGNLADVVLVTPGYEIVNDNICFIPDGAGTYQFIVSVTDSCGNAAADTGDVEIVINDGPVVDVGDTTIFICGGTEICLPIEFSDPDGYIDSIVVSAPAVYDTIEQAICVTIAQEGEYQIMVTVYDDCGISASDIGTIMATLNDKPILTIGEYQAQQSLCAPEEICIPVTAFDPNGNMASITGAGPCGTEFTYTQYEHTLCWMPLDFGLCSLTVIATDLCGLSDSSIVVIELIELPGPEIYCPNDTTLFLCDTGIACLDLGVLGQNPRVFGDDIIFNPALNRICFNVQQDRVDTILVVDSAECGVDSCSFVITSILNGPPVIVAENTIEQHFCEPFTFCFTVEISDPDDNIESVVIAGDCGGYYDEVNNMVCVDVVEDIDCNLEIIVTDSCGKSTSFIAPIKATRNLAPGITLPNLETVVRCETDTTTIFIANICVTDPDYDEVVLTLDSGLGEFVFNPITYCGTLSFVPPTNDSTEYCFRFAAIDDCDTTYETYCVTIQPTPVCETCVDVSIVGPGCVNIGSVPTVSIIAKAESEIAAFDLLVHYDASVLTFTQAYIGQAIAEWEYFTYRFGAVGNCDGSCPSGLIRLVGIADINDGPNHPPEDQYMPDGSIANMVFQVANNANLGGHNIPIGFFWYDCGDNSLSDPTGQYQLIDQAIFGPEGNVIWDEFNEAGYPENSRLPNVGAPDDCIVGDRDLPVRCVDFHNGDLCIIHPDSIDDRGDLNLNGIAYEIADAVVYTSYFIHGLAAFTISIPAQIVASDVNADGLTLSIADLVYLIRVVTGDANPYAKPIVGDNQVAVTSVPAGDNYQVSVDSENDIGAALLTFAYDGVLPGKPRLAEDVDDMEMIYNYTADGTLRVLIYSFESGRMIPAGKRDLVEIPGAAEAELSLIDIDMADYFGRTLKTDLTEVVLPDRLELSQNQPNPFNPSTTFNLALPQASDYDVTIYNITGQTVRRWTGYAGPGLITFEWDGTNTQGQRVATGVYLYRARAMGSEAIRKMILLK
ncbi:MAG: T9SS type A sorting domain-containing protein, partial [FCB group bacterium]|nr:T9SS type A sorting domain-containing protein [FCB group bacterium]